MAKQNVLTFSHPSWEIIFKNPKKTQRLTPGLSALYSLWFPLPSSGSSGGFMWKHPEINQSRHCDTGDMYDRSLKQSRGCLDHLPRCLLFHDPEICLHFSFFPRVLLDWGVSVVCPFSSFASVWSCLAFTSDPRKPGPTETEVTQPRAPTPAALQRVSDHSWGDRSFLWLLQSILYEPVGEGCEGKCWVKSWAWCLFSSQRPALIKKTVQGDRLA